MRDCRRIKVKAWCMVLLLLASFLSNSNYTRGNVSAGEVGKSVDVASVGEAGKSVDVASAGEAGKSVDVASAGEAEKKEKKTRPDEIPGSGKIVSVVEESTVEDEVDNGEPVSDGDYIRVVRDYSESGFYNNDVALSIIAKDAAGVKSVDYMVTISNFNSYKDKSNLLETSSIRILSKGHIDTDDNGMVIQKDSGFIITEVDGNLSTQLKKDLVIREDVGKITIDISMRDYQGNVMSFNDEFNMDKNAPDMKMSFSKKPKDDRNIFNDDVELNVEILEDNFRQKDTFIMVNNEAQDATFTRDSLELRYDKCLNFSKEGEYLVEVISKDLAGNVSDMQINFAIDKSAPQVWLDSNDAVCIKDYSVAKENVQVKANISGYDSRLKNILEATGVKDKNFVGAMDELCYEINVGDKRDGLYTVEATGEDDAGNKFCQTFNYRVNKDGSVYNLEDINAINGKYINESRDVVLEEYNPEDLNSDSIKVICGRDGVYNTLAKNKEFEVLREVMDSGWCRYSYYIFKDTFSTDGVYKLEVDSVDASGNINYSVKDNGINNGKSIQFCLDRTAPLISVIDSQKRDNAYELSVDVSDNLKLKEVEISIDGKNVNTYQKNDGVLIVNFPFSASQLQVTALDMAKNVTSKTYSFGDDGEVLEVKSVSGKYEELVGLKEDSNVATQSVNTDKGNEFVKKKAVVFSVGLMGVLVVIGIMVFVKKEEG